MAVLKAAKEHSPRTVVLVVTAFASTETAVEAMKLGAYDYVTKPFKLDELKLTVANALERRRLQEENQALKRQLRRERGFENFVGRSPKILDVFETIRKTADSGSTVMITGESGTGKELVAQALHYESSRRSGPFVSVNCGAVPETLMESELFGHVKGAFTGAVAEHRGPVRGGRQRHAVPRRDHRDPAHGAGEAAARDPGAADPPGRRHARREDRRAAGRRLQPRPGPRGRRRRAARGSLLPPQRHPGPPAAAARPARGHPAAGRPLHQEAVARGGPRRSAAWRRRRWRCWSSITGRGTSASWRT